jgi:hypothetical protein
MDPVPLRFAKIADVVSTSGLSRIVGPIKSMDRTVLATPSYTSARHERLIVTLESGDIRTFVVKYSRISEDWTSLRTSDAVGREPLVIETRELDPIWSIFESPYLGYAVEGSAYALLMRDLGPNLFPDVREPVTELEQEALLSSLARLHSQFQGSKVLELGWLNGPGTPFRAMDPSIANDTIALPLLPPSLAEGVTGGWEIARKELPASIMRILTVPPAEISQLWSTLPLTLIHGDAKIANFAALSNGSIAAFDWAWAGVAPSAVELGWYLAVNATRISGTKDSLLDRYRVLLKEVGGVMFDPVQWSTFRKTAVVAGARMLLWKKALSFAGGADRSIEEWYWWKNELAQI